MMGFEMVRSLWQITAIGVVALVSVAGTSLANAASPRAALLTESEPVVGFSLSQIPFELLPKRINPSFQLSLREEDGLDASQPAAALANIESFEPDEQRWQAQVEQSLGEHTTLGLQYGLKHAPKLYLNGDGYRLTTKLSSQMGIKMQLVQDTAIGRWQYDVKLTRKEAMLKMNYRF